jgi:hypothetical protein
MSDNVDEAYSPLTICTEPAKVYIYSFDPADGSLEFSKAPAYVFGTVFSRGHIGGSMKTIAARFVLVFVACLSVASCATKVIDPSDPRFDPTKFSFEDFRQRHFGQPIVYFNKLFPAGTDKAYVDKILVTVGHATFQETPNPDARYHDIGYYYKSHGFWEWGAVVSVTYDSHDKLVRIGLNSGARKPT